MSLSPAISSNGRGPTWQWLALVLLSLLLGVVSWGAKETAADVKQHDRQITSLVGEVTYLRAQLDRIEGKLDRLIDQSFRPPVAR